jgi:hypothetical protein
MKNTYHHANILLIHFGNKDFCLGRTHIAILPLSAFWVARIADVPHCEAGQASVKDKKETLMLKV